MRYIGTITISRVRPSPSEKPGSELRSDECAQRDRRAKEDSNEGDGIARAGKRVCGGAKSASDDPGDRAAKSRPSWRALTNRPDQSRERYDRKEYDAS
jgi:hypothetical protein